jgi:hypothetical protein
MTTDWPPYSIGPKDSIFALGVICVKFVELESIFQFIFGTIMRFDVDQTRVVAAKFGTEPALQMSRDCLSETGWPDDAKDRVQHFLSAMKICADNRNVLMHSHVAWRFGDKTVLFKRARSGSDLVLETTLAQLRQVADEMNVFCGFGRNLGNAINNTLEEVPVYPVSVFKWPAKPALPLKLEYTALSNA